MKERDFQWYFTNTIINVLKDENYYYRKEPDMRAKNGFSPKKPFDCCLFYDRSFYSFELKIHKKITAFPFNSIRDHQYWYTDNINKTNWGTWYYVIYLFCLKKIVFIHWNQLNIIKQETEKKSIKIDNLLKYSIPKKELKTYLNNLLLNKKENENH